MGLEERRRREMDAEAINDNALALMVVLEGPICYNVASFTTEEDVITGCSCADFQWNQTSCKHVCLLKPAEPTISIYQD
ncbi:hypothetical protein CU098_000109, partial [Rhizopus stolonifer]